MREEYPRPQFRRAEWQCLNGEWEYRTDRALSGTEQGFETSEAVYDERIEVPFCRESRLSGIADRDFCECAWYRRRVKVDPSWLEQGRRLLLHIGACDWRTDVWVNGKHAGWHLGGYTPMTFDLTGFADGHELLLTVRAQDDLRSRRQPCGKQSRKFASHGCSYTRVTGIWQTVWLESVPATRLSNVTCTPDVADGFVDLDVETVNADGARVVAEAFYHGIPAGRAEGVSGFRGCRIRLPLDKVHLWEIGAGRLYDLVLTMGEDRVESYFGMRSVGVRDGMLLLNGKPVFQRLVLDQGYYPDGIYTAPTDEALERDVLLAQSLGFNGARLHQKVFDERFLYHCDRHGYIVWGEYPSWGVDLKDSAAREAILREWTETVLRDRSHPALIGWCPLNETQPDQDEAFVRSLATLTRALDPTRLYIEASGWAHIPELADLLDYHCYESDPAKLREKLAPLAEGKKIRMDSPYTKCAPVGRPSFLSEFGGIRWSPDAPRTRETSWGYGTDPQSEDAFFARFEGQVSALLETPAIGAFCYTQLYDIEQEQNGLCTYDRKPKFDPQKIRRILTAPAASEG